MREIISCKRLSSILLAAFLLALYLLIGPTGTPPTPHFTFNTVRPRLELPAIISTSDHPIHIIFVGIGESSLAGMSITVKTMFLHTSSPITFHLLGDHLHRNHLQKLVHDRNSTIVLYYEWEAYKPMVDFIPNVHYGGVYAMLKLLIPELLPEEVKQIIVLDTDLMFNADVKELWRHFDQFGRHQALALAEENSVWYFNHQWPAVKNGYNSGVMLMHVQRLRAMGWYWFWRGELLQAILKIGQTDLGDQDVVNYLARVRPEIMFRLSCAWNRQWIRTRTPCTDPAEDKAPIKILHWNRFNKKIVTDDLPDDFKSLEKRIGGFN